MTPKCPLCNSENSFFFIRSYNIHGKNVLNSKETFTLNKCSTCFNIFITNLTIDSRYYRKYYKPDYYINDSKKTLLSFFLNLLTNFSVQMKENFILQLFSGKDKKIDILDVGSGDGIFLDKLSNKFNKYGIELSVKGWKLSRKLGLNVFRADFLKHNFKGQKFDVVTMWHVLEHVTEPRKLVKKVSSILKPGGIFIIAVPNTNSLGFRFGKEFWFHLDSPRHLLLPNAKNLSFLLTKNKFKVTKKLYEFYDSPLDLFWSIRRSWLRFIIYPFYPFFKMASRETLTIISQK